MLLELIIMLYVYECIVIHPHKHVTAGTNSGLPACQAVYHVGVGGALDPATMGLLSSPRCGNPDTIMEEPGTDQPPPEPPHDLKQIASDQHRPRRSVISRKESKHKHTAGKYDFSKQKYITPRDPVDLTASYVLTTKAKAGESLVSREKDLGAMADQEVLKTSAKWRQVARSRHPSVQQLKEWEPDSSVNNYLL